MFISLVQETAKASDKAHPDLGTLAAAQEKSKAVRGPTVLIKVLL